MAYGQIYSLLYFKFQIYNIDKKLAKNIAKKRHKNKDLVNF